ELVDGGAIADTLIRQEEECLILANRTAQSAAEQVLMEYGRRQGEVVVSIKEGVTVEVKRVAVILVGAVLDQRVHNAARVAAIFRVDGAGNQVEFLNRIRAGQQARRVQGDVIGVCSIDQTAALLRLAAVHGKGTEATAGSHNAGGKLFELGKVAPDQGQIHNLLRIDEGLLLVAGGLHLHRVRLYFHRLSEHAHFHADRQFIVLVHDQRDTGGLV